MNSRDMLLWLAGGAGVILIYAAYKDMSPSSIVTGYFQAGGSGAVKTGAGSTGTPTPRGRINPHGTVTHG